MLCIWCVCMFVYTKFDTAFHGKQNVSGLQVSVYDMVLMQVTQCMQCLETHLTDLLLGEAMLQLCAHTRVHIHTNTRTRTCPYMSAFSKEMVFRGSFGLGHTYPT